MIGPVSQLNVCFKTSSHTHRHQRRASLLRLVHTNSLTQSVSKASCNDRLSGGAHDFINLYAPWKRSRNRSTSLTFANEPCEACDPRSSMARGMWLPQMRRRCSYKRSCDVTCHLCSDGNCIDRGSVRRSRRMSSCNDFGTPCLARFASRCSCPMANEART